MVVRFRLHACSPFHSPTVTCYPIARLSTISASATAPSRARSRLSAQKFHLLPQMPRFTSKPQSSSSRSPSSPATARSPPSQVAYAPPHPQSSKKQATDNQTTEQSHHLVVVSNFPYLFMAGSRDCGIFSRRSKTEHTSLLLQANIDDNRLVQFFFPARWGQRVWS